MKRLIIITGDLAAGKSTLAASLSERLRIPYITKDSLKEIVCDVIGYRSREENRLLSVTATDDMIYFFNQCGLVGNDIILEANFRKAELMELEALVDQYDYQVVLIVLRGDIPLLYQRFLDRLTNRHIAHRSAHLDESMDKFASYIETLREEDLVFFPHYIDMSNMDEDEVTDNALEIIQNELGE